MRILQPVPFIMSNGILRTVLARGYRVLGCPFAAELFTVRKRSCGKLMFLRMSVSHSVHMRGVYPSMHWGRHPPGRHPPGQTPPPQCMLGYTHLRLPVATAADGKHPTEMHSC